MLAFGKYFLYMFLLESGEELSFSKIMVKYIFLYFGSVALMSVGFHFHDHLVHVSVALFVDHFRIVELRSGVVLADVLVENSHTFLFIRFLSL